MKLADNMLREIFFPYFSSEPPFCVKGGLLFCAIILP